MPTATLTEQDLFVLALFSTDCARNGGASLTVGCYSADQLNRMMGAGVVKSCERGWYLTAAGVAAVTAYRNRPDVKRNQAKADRAMRRHPAT